jgi:DNA topoisomerase I
MSKNLLIVESPAKAKTIEKYLGKDFMVRSSYGHIRDLETGNQAVDVNNKFQPKYVISPEKAKLVGELRGLVKKVDEVWLATDEDREGEAISWHLCEVLNLDVHNTKRIVFREITKPAIEKAVQQPRKLDLNLVNAQQARRVLDRLVGFELSEILWRKIRGKLSAGRVQSVAVKLVVEKEREINSFKSEPFFRIDAIFQVQNEQGKSVSLKAEGPDRFKNEGDAEGFLQKCIGASYSIRNIELRPLRRKPTAPFTTSTLQQEASRKLGFSVNRTMSTAQKLYEAGYITYMRTDSTSLSKVALASISQEIENLYGKNYVEIRRFKSKAAGAQEAHEAIRPTYIQNQSIAGDRDQQRLYELIWKRTISSQMADALLEKTVVDIAISTQPQARLQAEGEVLKFDGFLKVYLESNDDEEQEETQGVLPPLKIGQPLPLQTMTATERFTRPPARYSEAALVKKLEELGIGRPSTYAPTITKIMEEGRGYVVKEDREGTPRKYRILTLAADKISKKEDQEITGAVKGRLFSTDMGMVVSDFLGEHFDNIMDYQFTADIEKLFDEVATGQRDWTKLLEQFYWPFHEVVEQTMEKADRPTAERVLGKDQATGQTVITRMTRNGPVVQIGLPEELIPGEKPRYGNLKPGQSIETINFEEAMDLFKLPKTLGQYRDQDVVIGAGRFGPYVRFDEKFISIPRHEDPLELKMERAIELILEKEKADAPAATYKGLPVTKGSGRFGPFIKWNELFINVPKKYSLETLTTEQIHELIEAKLEKEASRFIQQWADEKIAIENGRWGPFIRFKKEMINLPKVDGQKMSEEQAAALSLEAVKKMIEEKIPDAFAAKEKKAAAKKAPAKKAPAKKTTTKKK